MKIRLFSDLHLEFSGFYIPPLKDDENTVLVLAGDIGLVKLYAQTIFDFVEEAAKRFRAVVFVAGNHEYYGSRIEKAEKILREGESKGGVVRKGIDEIDNVFFLQDDCVMIDGVLFVGATLWTNMNNMDSLTIFDAKNYMNDYRVITYNDKGVFRKLNPKDTIGIHYESSCYIFDTLKNDPCEKKVVVTHHAPSFKSVPERFKGSGVNGAYVSELSENILDTKPNLWFHGHTHDSFDYNIGDTRIVANPRGYSRVTNLHEENPMFDQYKVIEV